MESMMLDAVKPLPIWVGTREQQQMSHCSISLVPT